MRNGNGRVEAEDGRAVLGSFIEEQREWLLAIATGLCRNTDEAQDLVQETFRRVWKNWKRYDHDRPLQAWALVILRNTFLDSRKCCARKRVVSLDGLRDQQKFPRWPEPASSEPDLMLVQERSEEESVIRKAMRRLLRKHTEVLVLRDFRRQKYEEIAESLRLPVGTVRSRLNRARENLRKEWCRLCRTEMSY
jgi:RNA polymerase sigma-70 factor (ECF subfamily)